MKILRLFFLILTTSTLFAGIDEDLIKAAERGDTESVIKLLDRGADIHVRDPFGSDRPLRKAAENGHAETVKLLIDLGAHIDTSGALRLAAKNGHTKIVKLLLDHGANIHIQDNCKHQDAPLREAAENGHTEIVRLLLDRGADIHTENDYALRRTALRGHIETVRLLIDRGANFHADDDAPLKWAAFYGCINIKELLELCYMRGFEEFREASLAFIEDQKNIDKPVPPPLLLLWSIILNREDAFDKLLEITEQEDKTLSDEKMIIEETGKIKVADTWDTHHMTALMYAALLGNEYMCAQLVHAGAKINLKNERGKTAIQLAADAGYWNIASYLLRQLKRKNIF